MSLYAAARAEFEKRFKARPSHGASAPGRVNLIGEHTDYQDGFVFPLALEDRTVIVGSLSGSSKCTVRTMTFGGDEVLFDADLSNLRPGDGWGNYVMGVVACMLEAGYDIPGFNAVINSSVPVGGGLSSSAALEVATATFIESLIGRRLGKVEKALLCQKAEHTYAGMPCGIMDQFISSLAEEGKALLIDCRAQQPAGYYIPANIAIVVCNSNKKHKLTGSEYPDRVRQCKEAVKVLRRNNGGRGSHLRDYTLDDLELSRPFMNDVAYRRARHVISENARCLASGEALSHGDVAKVGKYMLASHHSLRRDFEVSTRQLDFLVDVAMRQPQVYGSRMTGGGFGGCTVSIVEKTSVDQVIAAVSEAYVQEFGIKPSCFVTKPGRGAEIAPRNKL